MSTKIEWVSNPDGTQGITWNPLAGCTRASSGCDLCYAAKMSLRLETMAKADIAAGKDPGGKQKYIGVATKNSRGVSVFNGKINLDYNALEKPLSWKKPQTIFVNSMSDLFHKDVPLEFIQRVFDVMKRAHWHQFQVLTKRSERLAELSPLLEWPANVWMGVSVENQDYVYRIDDLRKTGAKIKFLSVEPLLGPLPMLDLTGISWVIVGCESGPGARPMEIEWARSLKNQCSAVSVPFFMKQLSNSKGKAIKALDQFPEDLRIREYPIVLSMAR